MGNGVVRHAKDTHLFASKLMSMKTEYEQTTGFVHMFRIMCVLRFRFAVRIVEVKPNPLGAKTDKNGRPKG